MKRNILKFNIILFTLLSIGLLMIYSASSVWAEYKTGNQYYYLIRQGIFLLIGIVVYIISSKIKYTFWLKHANHIFILCLILLLLVLVPGIGIVRGGARSWIGLGDLSIQPAEFMKIGIIIFTSKFLYKNEGILKKNLYSKIKFSRTIKYLVKQEVLKYHKLRLF